MRILLTNDDGIDSPTLLPLLRLLEPDHQITVAVPATNQSGMAQAFTFSRGLHCTHTPDPLLYQVHGTPCDCVKFAINRLLDDKHPDCVLSGINVGENAGMSTVYSGTVAAAREGAMWGIPSLAVSIWNESPDRIEHACRWVARLLKNPLSNFIEPCGLLNINFPPCEPSDISGVQLTTMSTVMFKDGYREERGPDEKPVFWLEGYKPHDEFEDGSDDHALSHGRISITPLRVDQTHFEALQRQRDKLALWEAL